MKQYIVLFFLLLVIGAAPIKKQPVPGRILYSNPTELDKFMEHMAMRESSNKHTVVNRYGMLGRYQFSPRTIKSLGFTVSINKFLQTPKLQDSIMVAYMRANNKELKFIIDRYDGNSYKGIRITRAGILAAAHLVGSTNVKKYFANPDDMIGLSDANGTSLRDYLTEFNTHNLQEVF